jgi:hypothetical protein
LDLVYAHIKSNNLRVLHHNQHFIFSVSFYLSFFSSKYTMDTIGRETDQKNVREQEPEIFYS